MRTDETVSKLDDKNSTHENTNLLKTVPSGDSIDNESFEANDEGATLLGITGERSNKRKKFQALRKSRLPAIHIPNFEEITLPQWFLWLGWFAVFLYCVASTIFTVFYGLRVSIFCLFRTCIFPVFALVIIH